MIEKKDILFDTRVVEYNLRRGVISPDEGRELDALLEQFPDYAKLAEAMGCVGLRADKVDEVDAVIEQANAINDRPVVVDFRVDEFEKVYPMVPAGGSNDVVILGPEGDAELGKSGQAPS